MSGKDKSTEEYLKTEDLLEKSPENKGNWLKNFLLGPYWVAPLVVLIGVSAFAWGKSYSIKQNREPIKILDSRQEMIESRRENTTQKLETQQAAVVQTQTQNSSGQVVGSKNSNKYHYPWCSGAKRISKENLVTFASIEEARAKGYLPASNCSGLK